MPQDLLNQRQFSGCPSDANNYFIIFLKTFSGPSAPAVNVLARSLSSTSILVQWGEVPDTDKNGIILSYTINYQATPEGNPQQNQVVNASTREVTLTGLIKNTEYKIEVFANTSKGGGIKSEPFTVQTDEDSKYTIAQVTVRLLLQLHRRCLQVCNITQIYTVMKRKKVHLLMALNNGVFQLIHGRFANVLFANVLSHFTYVLGRFSYFFRLICG